jgi:SNF2 family DNA or RNA helicase
VLEILTNLDLLEFVHGDPADLEEIRRRWDLPNVLPPDSFQGDLYKYQLLGFRWMAGLSEKKRGGLLADDMGLGKTVQVIAHMSQLAEENALNPSLIVAPVTLLDNWKQEIERFLPSRTSVGLAVGTRQDRLAVMEQRPDIVLTSYDALRRDQLEAGAIDWKLVVCDEAQYAKNPTAQRTTVIKALKSAHRLALTGTPVENGLMEFWCIMDFVQPGLLGSRQDFGKRFEKPIAEAPSEERPVLVEKLQAELGPHYLRRLKEEVLDGLPTREVQSYKTGLSSAQLDRYIEVSQTALEGPPGERLAAIQRLLQVCALPAAPPTDGSAAQPGDCPKLDQTLQILSEVRDRGEKAIVFTRFLRAQTLLQQAIRERFGIFPDCINGSVTSNRQKIIDVFSSRDGFNVCILSHDVGGVGLNVTAANHVIHYTRPWNPAKENQASDRVYRIGQNRPVTIHLPIVESPDFKTVEERLNELLSAKSELARDVLVPRSELDVKASDFTDELRDAIHLR